MIFNKLPHPANFLFEGEFEDGKLRLGGHEFALSLSAHEGGVFHFRAANAKSWAKNLCLEPLTAPVETSDDRVQLDENGRIHVKFKGKAPLLIGSFGVLGPRSMFKFAFGKEAKSDPPKFFGMGEKFFGEQELSGYRSRYWNTDVWSDFHFGQWGGHPSDPPYFSTPYVLTQIGKHYIGMLLHNPYPAFMETPGADESRIFVEWQRTSEELLLGNDDGEPNLWIILGDSVAEVTRKLQKLVGVTPLPPVWSLGYHQSRWGYTDLISISDEFAKHEIPVSGIWMDLDYMDGFRIFTIDKEVFPEGPKPTVEVLEPRGTRIVPIIDPGVKSEKGYRVYDDGIKQNVFCQTPEGTPFVGLVWPGETVFPDFSQAKARNWWANYAKEFRLCGFGGCWVDMNDPSTGPVDPYDMLFDGGKLPHTAHRNQYALGMQMATHEGFLQAYPNERPFILSRSGYIGSSKYAAIWTGDNVSNRFYLKISIPTAIGMSLSGLPFAGMDIGGFGDSVSDDLMLDWMKLAFLFPFCRNHCKKGEREQEPYAFPVPVMNVLRRLIRLRYKLMPHIYNLFVAQERDGDPILRPMQYHFEDAGLEQINDQFMIGPSILQAPFLEESKTREVVLPGQKPWYDATCGEWIQPGTVTVKRKRECTPLYIAEASILPMLPGTPKDANVDLSTVNFHVFVPKGYTGETSTVYHADDGVTFAYQKGVRSSIKVRIVGANGHLVITMDELADDFGPIDFGFVIHGEVASVKIQGQTAKLKPAKVTLTGSPLNVVTASL